MIFSLSMKLTLILTAAFAISALADGVKDNSVITVRPVPPLGMKLPEAEIATLTAKLAALREAIDAAAKAQAKHPLLAELLPDLEIYHKAVDWALRYDEFFPSKNPDPAKVKPKDLQAAHEMLAEGLARAQAFVQGKAPWTRQTGLVVRGYRSKIDGSVQPYGMVVPETGFAGPQRLDLWCHGRFEDTTELGFMQQRRTQVGMAQPKSGLVLHPFGRFSCANKFAGEVDLFEAMEHAKKFYPIDEDRLIIRGFSMGGAAAWQFGVHYADLWCAASPGAGFAETSQFLKVFQGEDVDAAPPYQKKLWHWYDATDSALNFAMCPLVAYSGELDKQKQAADIMERALLAEQLDMVHIIGPKTEHKIHPDSAAEIERRLGDIATAGRDRCPDEVHFATWTLRYNKMRWIVVDALQQHWQRTRVHARIKSDRDVEIKTQNIAALTLDMPAGHCTLMPFEKPRVKIDGAELEVRRPRSDRSWLVHLRKEKGQWQETLHSTAGTDLAKAHGLQGPIDDAFMSSFLHVRPTGKALHEAGQAWAKNEMERAVYEWRRQFRGDAPMKDDSAVTEQDLAQSNLILWGDPSSNALLKRIIDKLPLQWTAEGFTLKGKSYTAGKAMPVMIYPNPLNPQRYIVLNSSFTYREYDYLNNARQIAKLPDWAVIDITQAKTSQAPGGIADAGFFDEAWK
jgi:predicted peptidase